jgi:hypothetical protein
VATSQEQAMAKDTKPAKAAPKKLAVQRRAPVVAPKAKVVGKAKK